MSRILRDARVGQIYEGTTGIHAMTLAGRSIHVAGTVESFRTDIEEAAAGAQQAGNKETAKALTGVLEEWLHATEAMVASPRVGALADAYMRLTGLVAFAGAWARIEKAAEQAPDPTIIRSLARFVRAFMLPEAVHHARMCQSPLRLDDVPASIFQA